MTTEIVLPFATPSLNVTMAEHWSKKTKRRNNYQNWIISVTRNRHPGPVRFELYGHRLRLLDRDNFIGGAKSLVDALKRCGVIVDDTEQIITQPHYEQVKVMKKEQVMTVIRITDLPEGITHLSIQNQ